VTALLPKGMTIDQAARGFKNQGQFIAALHVSRNLGIPFADLKKDMVTNDRSLGQAIQHLRPGANSTTESERGETEAHHDMSTTPATTTSGSGATTSTTSATGTTTSGSTGTSSTTSSSTTNPTTTTSGTTTAVPSHGKTHK
jgi:hypothetical protein